jgi:hypothetical protein
VANKNFFAPLRAVPMEGAEISDEASSSENTDKGRPPPIVLTSEANLPSLQKDLKTVVTGEFFFRNTASGTRLTTRNMTDYKATQNLLSQKNLPFYTFYTKGDKQVKAVISHLPSNTSSEDITVALQELGYEAISVKQMTAKRPSPAGGDTLVSLPLFLVTLVRKQKSQEIFKITKLCSIIVKVEGYKSKSGLTQCYNCQRFGHIWVHCRQPPRCLWCGGGQRHRECPEKLNNQSIPSCCNCKLKDGDSSHKANYRGCSHTKEELQRKEEPTHDKPRIIRKNLLLQVHNARAVVSLCSTQPRGREQKESAGPPETANHQQRLRSVKANIVNNNAMDDTYVAFTMVQQIMTGLSGAASEEEKFQSSLRLFIVY